MEHAHFNGQDPFAKWGWWVLWAGLEVLEGSITWIFELKNWLAFDRHGWFTSVLSPQYFGS